MQNDMIKPATQGVVNVLKACAKARTTKRVILTSSAAAVSVNKLTGTGLVMDETNWTDVEFLTSEKPPTWVNHLYSVIIFPSTFIAKLDTREWSNRRNYR